NRIEIIGISGPQGQKPLIDGDGAVTVPNVNFWNESRGVIKIGGSNTPADNLPAYITINNLEIRSGHPSYMFTNDNGQIETYASNAAAIYVEKAALLIIRNCTLHDCGNGIFIGAFNGQTEDILIEHNYIHGNGIVGSAFEHNTYTEAIDITYQYNHFGPLRSGADGNNLKDRSAGLTIRYNWIESGNRQLDLVESGSTTLINDPKYQTTYAYGNILIEPDGAGNSQITHYGGDGGSTGNYRKGTFYFFNNTIISTRSGNTTLMRLSTSDETAEVFNNIIYNTAAGGNMAMMSGTGIFNMFHNWSKTGWKVCHCTPSDTLNDLGGNLTGTDPGFINLNTQDFHLIQASPVINMGDTLPSVILPSHQLSEEYQKHQYYISRIQNTSLDMGAFELGTPQSGCIIISDFVGGFWSNGPPNTSAHAYISDQYSSSQMGSFSTCACTISSMGSLTIANGDSVTIAEHFQADGTLDVQQGGNLSVQNPE
ncbi:MAG: hypothetical protein OEQ53_11685, partial [Saprospiraceae bacterium]|nr:hypothetical protein [Saprospiraceae bacterium]